MNPSLFVAAYAVTLAGTGGLVLWTWYAMRRTEREGEELKR